MTASKKLQVSQWLFLVAGSFSLLSAIAQFLPFYTVSKYAYVNNKATPVAAWSYNAFGLALDPAAPVAALNGTKFENGPQPDASVLLMAMLVMVGLNLACASQPVAGRLGWLAGGLGLLTALALWWHTSRIIWIIYLMVEPATTSTPLYDGDLSLIGLVCQWLLVVSGLLSLIATGLISARLSFHPRQSAAPFNQ